MKKLNILLLVGFALMTAQATFAQSKFTKQPDAPGTEPTEKATHKEPKACNKKPEHPAPDDGGQPHTPHSPTLHQPSNVQKQED